MLNMMRICFRFLSIIFMSHLTRNKFNYIHISFVTMIIITTHKIEDEEEELGSY